MASDVAERDRREDTLRVRRHFDEDPYHLEPGSKLVNEARSLRKVRNDGIHPVGLF